MSARITDAMVEAAAKVISPQAWKERLRHLERAEHWERIAINDTQRSLVASHRENAISVVQQSLQTARESLAAALSTEPGEAEGMVLVPREPSREMIRAGSYAVSGLTHTGANCVYRAMLAAAPLPEDTHHGR